MTTQSSSAFRLTRYTLAVAALAMIVIAISFWTNGTRQQVASASVNDRMDIDHLSASVGSLPVLKVEWPF